MEMRCPYPWTRALREACLGVSLLLALGCSGADEVTIGPDGGTLKSGKLTVTIPPGALVVERKLSIVASDDDLTQSGFTQSGKAYELQPTDLQLRIPATVEFEVSDEERPTVLHQVGMRTSAFPPGDGAAIAHIIKFGVVALAAGGEPLGSVSEPELKVLPTELPAPFVDSVSMSLTPTSGGSTVDIVLTAYDMEGNYNRPLNDNEDNSLHCGFTVTIDSGGLVSAGCISGVVTASITPTAATVNFTITPFLIDKVDDPVAVLVGAGSGTFVTNLGYFPFKTGACFGVSCSGYGQCMAQGDQPACACNEGYANGVEDPLTCQCVPKCEGRVCGTDSCGGSCGGCGENMMCTDDGQCVNVPDPGTTDMSTTDMTTDSDTDMTTDMPTTDMPTTDMSTTDMMTTDMSTTDMMTTDTDTDTGTTTDTDTDTSTT